MLCFTVSLFKVINSIMLLMRLEKLTFQVIHHVQTFQVLGHLIDAGNRSNVLMFVGLFFFPLFFSSITCKDAPVMCFNFNCQQQFGSLPGLIVEIISVYVL